MAKLNDPVVPDRITPQDLEDKFKALQGEIQGRVDEQEDLDRHHRRRHRRRESVLLPARSTVGWRRSAVVEIRRV